MNFEMIEGKALVESNIKWGVIELGFRQCVVIQYTPMFEHSEDAETRWVCKTQIQYEKALEHLDKMQPGRAKMEISLYSSRT